MTDRCTGPMWQKATPLTPYAWRAAVKYCEDLTLAGSSDRRMPKIRELLSIVDYGRVFPAIDPALGAVFDVYGSSSTFAQSAANAWTVISTDGGVGTSTIMGRRDYLRPVGDGL